MYLTPTSSHWACDIEADNLLDKATRIWCCVVVNLVTKEEHTFTSRKEFAEWRENNPSAVFVGHNFLSYDMPMLNRFWGAGISERKVVDTFVLSQIYSPTFKGGHSLEAWGQRLRYPKGDFNDFSRLSPEMLRYCRKDTLLVGLLFLRLSERMRSVGFVEDGCRLEHLAWHIIQNKQRRNGFPFNYKKATALYAELRAREEELKNEIYRLWPPRRQAVKTFAQGRKKNGERTTGYLRHLEQYPELRDNPDGSYTAYDDVCFNLGSPPQRIEKLLELGWKPVNKTKAGNPKVDEDELLAFAEVSGKSELKALAKWIVVNSRANMVNTWLEAYNHETKAIHGRLFIASTMRYRHSNPNSANIPSVRMGKDENDEEFILYGEEGAWTYECRDLWWAGEDEDFVLVGIDGTGIQNRCLIHSCIDTVGEDEVAPFKELSLHGDIHKRNIEVLGLANKPAAKKAYYCVPMETMALTKNGWKFYEEIEVGELILTYNQALNVKEWQPVLEKVKFDDAPIVEMGHSRYSVKSTPNHRWFTEHRLTHAPTVTTTEDMNTMQNIIVNAPFLGDEQPSDEGYMSYPKYGTDWVAKVLAMSHKEREAFLAGFCIADGYQNDRDVWLWSQLRGPLFEGALLASYLVHDGVINVNSRIQENGNEIATVTLNKKQHVSTAHFEYRELERQPVWCVRTENESWVMRQGDVITITGNTIMMGGGGGRIAADQAQFGTKLTAKEGEALRQGIIANIPGFQATIERLQEELANTGRITLCSGTPILVPSPHMVIPYKLQGDESQLMKLALIFVDKIVTERGWENDAFKVADIHDEWQWRVRKSIVKEFIMAALPCFVKAGEFFNYNIEITGDAKEGRTWAETH